MTTTNEETVWSFETARFCVELRMRPCEDDPSDMFDDDGESAAMIESGEVDWFDARVVVLLDDREVGSDALCCCAYRRGEFQTSHRDRDPMNRNCSLMRAARGGNVVICHYFPDMVRLAVAEARKVLGAVPYLRAA